MKTVKISLLAVVAAFAMAADAQNFFTALPLCLRIEGEAQVRLPNGEWTPAEEGKFYPLGTSYRTKKDEQLVLAFGPESKVEIKGDAAFGTRSQPLETKTRTVSLMYGTLEFKLASNLPEGAFVVSAPGFVVKNPAGGSRIAYETTGDGDKAVVRCVTGSLGVEGRHFNIPVMRAANEVVIRTTHDHLSTILYGTSGDYAVKLDQGLCEKADIDDNGQQTSKVEKSESEWRLSPKTKVIINRSVPAIGKRMSVHTMAFDAAGERKSEFCFCEGRSELSSGELVPREAADSEELAKRAAEASETTDAEATTEDAPAEDKESSDAKDSKKSSEEE